MSFRGGRSCTPAPGGRRFVDSKRENGKSYLAGYLAADSLTPGGALFEAGAENVLL